jgi:Spy/CpxP family protein refolding chaperone
MRKRSLWLVLPIVCALGCDENKQEGPATAASAGAAGSASAALAASASAAPVASAVKAHTRPGHHGGIASGLFHAAHDLTLAETQKDSLDTIETNLKGDDDGMRTAMKSFRADLLAGVKAGKLDSAKLTTDQAAIDKAIADHRDKEAAALDSLHGLLDATQRASVVAAVRAKDAEHEAKVTAWMSEKDAKGAAPDWNKKRLDKLTADLTLDAAQQKQVAAILAKTSDPPNAAGMQARWDEMKKRKDALLTAFAGDTFDAKKADLTMLPGKTAHEPMDHITSFYTQLLPVLHPDQRDKLATSMDRPFGIHESQDDGHGGRARGVPDDIAFPFAEPPEPMPADSPAAAAAK